MSSVQKNNIHTHRCCAFQRKKKFVPQNFFSGQVRARFLSVCGMNDPSSQVRGSFCETVCFLLLSPAFLSFSFFLSFFIAEDSFSPQSLLLTLKPRREKALQLWPRFASNSLREGLYDLPGLSSALLCSAQRSHSLSESENAAKVLSAKNFPPLII